jgi:diacylglycerol kinase family enzyme
MAGVPEARVRELWATLWPAVPGAAASVLALVVAVAVVAVALVRQPLAMVASLLGLVVAAPLATVAVWSAGLVRRIAVPVAVLVAAVPCLLLLLGGRPVAFVLVVSLLLASAWAAGQALHAVARRPRPAPVPGTPVGPASAPVLFVNPRSGGGGAERAALASHARRRGVECVVLGPGDDLRRLAEEAADRGAGVLGMAGGDGSQGVVAKVAVERGLAFVCVPVGTRNHFALDLGLDPADPVGALDAFGDAEERTVDVGMVGDRVFVNNVSLGVYAKVISVEGYREHKAPTAWQVLGGVFGPEAEAEPFDLRFTGPDGQEHAGYHLVLVSNDPYGLTADRRFGSRERMDRGMLGIVAARAGEGEEFPRFAEAWWLGQADPARGWLRWEAPRFEVRSDGPIPAGVDGEALVFEPPLRFRSLPGALRVRVPAAARDPLAVPVKEARVEDEADG